MIEKIKCKCQVLKSTMAGIGLTFSFPPIGKNFHHLAPIGGNFLQSAPVRRSFLFFDIGGIPFIIFLHLFTVLIFRAYNICLVVFFLLRLYPAGHMEEL